MNTITASFIAAVSTHDTGGNCKADLIELKSGRAICIADESVAVYKSAKDFHDNADESSYRELFGVGTMTRGDSAVALTFVERIETFEPNGPVSVDLIILCDGRVLGVDSDSLVMYPSKASFERTTADGVTEDVLSMSLDAEGGAS